MLLVLVTNVTVTALSMEANMGLYKLSVAGFDSPPESCS